MVGKTLDDSASTITSKIGEKHRKLLTLSSGYEEKVKADDFQYGILHCYYISCSITTPLLLHSILNYCSIIPLPPVERGFVLLGRLPL